MLTALIYAAGSGSRWKDAGLPKQLFEIGGEPILHRTVRQLKKRGARPIIITGDDRLHVDGAEAWSPGHTRYLSETILKSADLWTGRMAGVFGDVIWTNEAMDILCSTEGFRFLGRENASQLTGGCPELFGWVWGEADNARLVESMQVGVADAEGKPSDYDYMTGAIWQPYRWLCGIPIDNHCQVDDVMWLRVDDYTDDVDYPASGKRLRRVWERHRVQ